MFISLYSILQKFAFKAEENSFILVLWWMCVFFFVICILWFAGVLF